MHAECIAVGMQSDPTNTHRFVLAGIVIGLQSQREGANAIRTAGARL